MREFVYVGAYLLIPVVRTSKETPIAKCPRSCGYAVVATDSFCAGCGTPIEVINHIEPAAKHLYCHNLEAKFNDFFSTPESGVGKSHTLWLPNRSDCRSCGEYYRSNDIPLEKLDEMPDDFVSAMRAQLTNDYGDVLLALKESFSLDVKVRVGIVPGYF